MNETDNKQFMTEHYAKTHTRAHTHTHTCMHARSQAGWHAPACKTGDRCDNTYTYPHIHMSKCTLVHICRLIRTLHTRIHTRTHTYTHKHTVAFKELSICIQF